MTPNGWDKFAEGMAARLVGEQMMGNPYLTCDAERYSWDSGWMTQDAIGQIALAQRVMARLRRGQRLASLAATPDDDEYPQIAGRYQRCV